ncbi:MAG: hypothetical protein HZA54_03975 [Planctomycetes bacterium]|nr:hypothetical protein [Planctomycetota bacterium]
MSHATPSATPTAPPTPVSPAEFEFDLWCTVVVPWTFGPECAYRRELRGRTLAIGALERHFVALPPGASCLVAELEVPAGAYGRVRAIAFDPAGRELGGASADSEKDGHGRWVLAGPALETGVYEIVVAADFHARATSTYDLTLSTAGLACATPGGRGVAGLSFGEGERPHGTATAVNRFAAPFEGKATGDASTLRRTQRREAKDADTVSFPLRWGKETESFAFAIEFSAEDYNRFTDILVALHDKEGHALATTALGQRRGRLEWKNDGDADRQGSLVVEGGMAAPDRKGTWSVELVETRRLREKVGVRVTARGEEELTLWPETPEELRYELERAPTLVPQGFARWLRLEFRDRRDVLRAAEEFALPPARR